MSKNSSKNPDAQVDEAIVANDSETEQSVSPKTESTNETENSKLKSNKSEEAEAKRIMLQRGVNEVYKVGKYWFTNKQYAENHSKTSQQKIKTFQKQ